MSDYLSCGSCPSVECPNTDIVECLLCFKKFFTRGNILKHLQDYHPTIIKFHTLFQDAQDQSVSHENGVSDQILVRDNETQTDCCEVTDELIDSHHSLSNDPFGDFHYDDGNLNEALAEPINNPLLSGPMSLELTDGDGNLSFVFNLFPLSNDKALDSPDSMDCEPFSSFNGVRSTEHSSLDRYNTMGWNFPRIQSLPFDCCSPLPPLETNEFYSGLLDRCSSTSNVVSIPPFIKTTNEVKSSVLCQKTLSQSNDHSPLNVSRFICRRCNRSFRQNNHLQKHIMTYHDRRKPYRCPRCNYSTGKKSHLNAHIRKHTGEKSFQGRHRESSVGQKSTLKCDRLRKNPKRRISCKN